jgi:hypothetical protein
MSNRTKYSVLTLRLFEVLYVVELVIDQPDDEQLHSIRKTFLDSCWTEAVHTSFSCVLNTPTVKGTASIAQGESSTLAYWFAVLS